MKLYSTSTLSHAREIARELGFSIRRKDGEIRINKLYAEESTAYYTNDIKDAIITMIVWNNNAVSTNAVQSAGAL